MRYQVLAGVHKNAKTKVLNRHSYTVLKGKPKTVYINKEYPSFDPLYYDLDHRQIFWEPKTPLTHVRFMVNKNAGSRELHKPDCPHARRISSKNLHIVTGSEENPELQVQEITEWINKGYDGCYYCMREFHTK